MDNYRLSHLRPTWRTAVVLAATAALAFTVAMPTPAAVSHATSADWTQPNGDQQGTRHVGGPINSHTVGQLSPVWTVPIVGNVNRFSGGDASTPVVVDGVVYLQDLDSNVYAVDLRTGHTLWTTMYSIADNGPNGVAVADGKVYGTTSTFVFALDVHTGTELWRKTIIRNSGEAIDMAPGVHDGTVYASTVPTYSAGNGQGVLWALDGQTGATKWTWATVPADLWGDPSVNVGGGLWYPPTFDAQGNLYIAVANPAPDLGTPTEPWGGTRPGPDLYTNSLVKLDGRTGKMLWYYQVLPHDVYDWDLQNSPILTTANGRPVVIATGKIGIVFEFDQATGALLWKTPVGTHNGHDNDDLYAMNGQTDKLPALPVQVYPGLLGGEPAPAAVDGDTIYVAANEYPVTWADQQTPQFGDTSTATGEIIALDLVTGKIKWQHKLTASPYGGTTVANDLVFTTTLDGTVLALNTQTGDVAWQAALPAETVGAVAIDGDTLLTAAGWPQNTSQTAEFIAYRLTTH